VSWVFLANESWLVIGHTAHTPPQFFSPALSSLLWFLIAFDVFISNLWLGDWECYSLHKAASCSSQLRIGNHCAAGI